MQLPIDDSPLPRIPARAAASHKGDFGRILLIGGSVGMAGSISLAGMAALRTGAGLVRLVVPSGIVGTVASFEPSYMTQPVEQDSEGRILSLNSVDWSWPTGAGIGPGLGSGESTGQLVQKVTREAPVPLVIDADGLNALATQTEVLKDSASARVVTPHPGEFQRLAKFQDKRLGSDNRFRAQSAAEFAAQFKNVILVLKGVRTVVTDGKRIYQNSTGNPGMATGGSGDVLTGMITTLLGQGFAAYDAARLGVYLHGLAGDLAAKNIGLIGMIARDLLQFIPAAIQSHMSEK